MPVTLKKPEMFGDVEVQGGYTGPEFITDRLTFTKAKLMVSGDTLALAIRDIREGDGKDPMDRGSKRFRQFDRIPVASSEQGVKGQIIFTGISEQLTEQGLQGEDAMVRWTLVRERCATC